jgi:hypothetical protein
MKSRLAKFYEEMTAEITERELAEGISNGDIDCPGWLAYSPTTAIGFAIWDNEVSDGTTKLINLDVE